MRTARWSAVGKHSRAGGTNSKGMAGIAIAEGKRMVAIAEQAITGLTSMEESETVIYEQQPSVAKFAIARLLGPLYALAIPFGFIVGLLTFPIPIVLFFVNVLSRYVVSSQRVLIRHTLTRKVYAEVKLTEVADARLSRRAGQEFYRAADIELVGSNGNVLLCLPAVPNPESFRRRVLEARDALVKVRRCLAGAGG